MEKIYKFELHNRGGSLDGVFILNNIEIESLKSIDGCQVGLGEVLGKHSHISHVFYFHELQMVSEDSADIEFFKKLFPEKYVGFNFKAYWLNTEEIAEEGYNDAFSGTYTDLDEAATMCSYQGMYKEAYLQGYKEGLNYV